MNATPSSTPQRWDGRASLRGGPGDDDEQTLTPRRVARLAVPPARSARRRGY
jgi:hypothetical protein